MFYNNKKNFMTSPPPPPRRRTFRRTFRKNFLGHFKKNIVHRIVAEKNILASNWELKKNSCTEKLPNPPLKYLMVRPLDTSLRLMLISGKLSQNFFSASGSKHQIAIKELRNEVSKCIYYKQGKYFVNPAMKSR